MNKLHDNLEEPKTSQDSKISRVTLWEVSYLVLNMINLFSYYKNIFT